jgi:hypothetical protein
MAHAAEVYGRRQQFAEEAIQHATAIKVDALALMGEFLRSAEKNKGTAGQLKGKDSSGASRVEAPEETAPTLAESGITWKESSNAQTLAAIKEDEPEVFQEVRAGKVSVTRACKAARAKVACSSKRGRRRTPPPASRPSGRT